MQKWKQLSSTHLGQPVCPLSDGMCVTCAGSRLSAEKRSPSGASWQSQHNAWFSWAISRFFRFSVLCSTLLFFCFCLGQVQATPQTSEILSETVRSFGICEQQVDLSAERFNAGNMSLCYASMKLSWHLMRSLHTPSYFHIFHYTATQSQTTLPSQCVAQPLAWDSESLASHRSCHWFRRIQQILLHQSRFGFWTSGQIGKSVGSRDAATKVVELMHPYVGG